MNALCITVEQSNISEDRKSPEDWEKYTDIRLFKNKKKKSFPKSEHEPYVNQKLRFRPQQRNL